MSYHEDYYELPIPGTPPSVNTTGVGASKDWYRFHNAKKQWQGSLFIALLHYKVPKDIWSVHATAKLYFPTKRRRDEGNYRALLEKALGDALQLGWLPDDTPEHFTFGEVVFEHEKGRTETILQLEVQADPCSCDEDPEKLCELHDAG